MSVNMKKSKYNFSFIDLGPFANIDQYIFTLPKSDKKVIGKKFLKNELDLTSMEVSINKLAPGESMPFSHKHQENEELYLFLKGNGEFCVDDEWLKVQEGSAIRIAPNGIRTWRNSSKDDLIFIVIQAKANTMLNRAIEDGILVKP